MSWDVATSGSYAVTTYNNGAAITFVTKTGEVHKIDPEINSFMASGAMHSRYNTRFDDPRYYSGDSAS